MNEIPHDIARLIIPFYLDDFKTFRTLLVVSKDFYEIHISYIRNLIYIKFIENGCLNYIEVYIYFKNIIIEKKILYSRSSEISLSKFIFKIANSYPNIIVKLQVLPYMSVLINDILEFKEKKFENIEIIVDLKKHSTIIHYRDNNMLKINYFGNFNLYFRLTANVLFEFLNDVDEAKFRSSSLLRHT
jgi:hypothetical protein